LLHVVNIRLRINTANTIIVNTTILQLRMYSSQVRLDSDATSYEFATSAVQVS